MTARRWGVTVPLDGYSLPEHRDLLVEAEKGGYTDFWSAEVSGTDAFTPLSLFAGWTGSMHFGTAIANIYTRTPTLLAQSAAAVAEAAPGRFMLGIGTSSPAIVERWNGVPLEKPLQRMREVVSFLKQAFTGEKTTFEGETFHVNGFRLERPPENLPVYVAALREKMLRLAGAEADGVILNWLSPGDVSKVVPIAKEAAKAAGKDPESLGVACRIFVIPTEDPQVARMMGRFMIAGYLTTPVYYPFHQWLGRGEALAPMMKAWSEGDRQQALGLVPEDVVDDIVVYGSTAQIHEKINAYCHNGVTIPVLAIIPTSRQREDRVAEVLKALKDLAPQQ